MRNLVTGGAGFVGSHLVDALVARGDDVLVVDDLSSGDEGNLDRALASGRARLVRADAARSADAWETLLAAELGAHGLDRIWHLASPASPEAYGARPWETLAVNGLATMALIEIAVRRGARFLFTSTSEIYGDPLVHPQPESYFGNVDPIGPRSCYDEGKRFGEAAVATGVRARGLDGRIVRFFNCYGPKMARGDGRLVPALIDALVANAPFPLHGTGAQMRSMTYIDDAIALLLLVMERSQAMLEPVNVGNDDERSVEEIARTLAAIAEVPFRAVAHEARPGDPQRRRPDLTRARSYGWAPRTSLEDGLRTTWRWFREERLAPATSPSA